MSDRANTMSNTHLTAPDAGATAGPSRGHRDCARRPGIPAVQTSTRMSRGTREALNYIQCVLNKNKNKGEPTWSLGEVIELSINRAYEPWRKIRDAVNRNPKLKAEKKRRRRPPSVAPEGAPPSPAVGDRSTAA